MSPTDRLYLVGYADGVIKVGRTRSMRQRLRALAHQRFGKIVWYHIFPPRSGMQEYLAVCSMKAVGQRQGNSERFVGLTKEQAITICRSLISERLRSESEACAYREKRAFMEAAWETFKAQHIAAATDAVLREQPASASPPASKLAAA
jgi:hypothetical protein